MRLPVVAQVQHEVFAAGVWAAPVSVDCYGWWPASPESTATAGVGALPEVNKLQIVVPRDTPCGHRDRWTVDGVLLEQVGTAADYGHGPFGLAAPLVVFAQSPAESLLTDSCQLQSQSGSSMDPNTGAVTLTWATYWSGACRLATDNAGQRSEIVAGDVVSVSDLTLSLPIAATTPAVGHRVVMASGLILTVTGGDAGTSLVLQQIPVSREVPRG